MLEEEGVETVVEIVREVFQRTDVRQDLADKVLMIGEDLLERVGAEVITGYEVEILAEGEATQVVRLDGSADLLVLFFQAHNARAGENDLQIGV